MKHYEQYAGCGIIRVDEFTIFRPRLVGRDLTLKDWEKRDAVRAVIEKMCHKLNEYVCFDKNGNHWLDPSKFSEIEEIFSGGQIKINPESVKYKTVGKYEYSYKICHSWDIDFEVDSVPNLDFGKLVTD